MKNQVRLIALLLLIVLLTGCGAGAENQTVSQTAETAEDAAAYTVMSISATDLFGEFHAQAVYQSKLYALDYSGEPLLWQADADGGNAVSVSVQVAEGENASDLAAASDGLWCLLCSYAEAGNIYSGLESVSVARLDPDSGEILERVALADTPSSIPDGFCIDGEGRIYLLSGQRAMVFDEAGAVLGSSSSSLSINQMAVTEDGQVVVMDQQLFPYLLNGETQAVTALEEFSFLSSGDSVTLAPGIGCALFVHTNSGLYSYDLTGQWEQVLDYTAGDDTLGSCLLVGAADASTWIYDASLNSVSPSGLMVSLGAEAGERVTLTVGTLSSDYELKTMISAFNYAQTEYELEYLCYAEEYDLSGSNLISRLQVDFAAGRLPDILVCSSQESSLLGTLSGAGYLVDLYTLMDADAEFAAEDYLDNVWQALETDGALYQICADFQINCLVGTGSRFSDWGGSIQSLIQMQEDEPDVTFLGNVSRDMLLRWSCTHTALSAFIDWESGTCDFAGEDFQALLAFIATFPEEMDDDTLYESLYSGEADLVYADLSLGDATWYTMFHGEETYLPIPGWDGGSMQITASQCLAITTACASESAAWEFIKTYLTPAYQAQISSTLPVLRAALEDQLALLRLSHSDKNSPYYGFNQTINGTISLEAPELTQADTDQLLALIESADVSSAVDPQVYAIVEEETAAYFAGDKSAATVADLIQDRVQTYLWEQS